MRTARHTRLMIVGDYPQHMVLLPSNKDLIINSRSTCCCSARIVTINKLHFSASRVPLHQMQNMSLDPKRRFALSGSSDEDPYSLTSGNGSSGSSARFNKQSAADKTPVLNKKERDFFVPQNWSATQDRKRDRSRDNFLDDEPEISTLKPRTNNRRRILKKTEDKKTTSGEFVVKNGDCVVENGVGVVVVVACGDGVEDDEGVGRDGESVHEDVEGVDESDKDISEGVERFDEGDDGIECVDEGVEGAGESDKDVGEGVDGCDEDVGESVDERWVESNILCRS